MTRSFSLGINKAWGVADTVQAPGFYWLNIDQKLDAERFCHQIIRALPADAHAVLICQAAMSEPLWSELKQAMENKVPLFALSAKKTAVLHLTTDLMRSLTTSKHLFLILTTSSLWQGFTKEEMHDWVQKTNKWLNDQQSTLLVLNHGPDAHKLNQQLLSQYRFLDGLSYLKWQPDKSEQLISWWATEQGLIANQTLSRAHNEQKQAVQPEPLQKAPLAAQDELLAVADKSLHVTHEEPADEKISAWQSEESKPIIPIALPRTTPVNITLSTGKERDQKSN